MCRLKTQFEHVLTLIEGLKPLLSIVQLIILHTLIAGRSDVCTAAQSTFPNMNVAQRSTSCVVHGVNAPRLHCLKRLGVQDPTLAVDPATLGDALVSCRRLPTALLFLHIAFPSSRVRLQNKSPLPSHAGL